MRGTPIAVIVAVLKLALVAVVTILDLAPQGKVDIDQDPYTSLMRCYDKANYSKETLERITALQDSHGISAMHSSYSSPFVLNVAG